MAKSIVVAQHVPGPLPNGAEGCNNRWGNGGMCGGVKTAEWLNALGEDEEFYIKPTSHHPAGTTNLDVRVNWVRAGNCHVIWKDPTLAELRAKQRRLAAELRHTMREIARIQKAG